ncbi:hypothetical protein BD413DRAFT_218968 [Trametes elegans]|nr:hypothetical protein BD413DRAFT_218968 [Trametes elegans]
MSRISSDMYASERMHDHSQSSPSESPNGFVSEAFYDQSTYHVPFHPNPAEYRDDRPACLHYVPPSAVSTRYYALSNPNVYAPREQAPTVRKAAPARPGHAAPPPAGTVTLYTMSPSPPSSPARRSPNLPKQRRNRDDPGGEPHPLVQATTHVENRSAGTTTQRTSHDSRVSFRQGRNHDAPGAPVISDSEGTMTGVGGPSERALARHSSPPADEDAASLGSIQISLGVEVVGHASASRTPRTDPAASDIDYEMNRSAIYSPTTGRKLALPSESGPGAVQIMPGMTNAKRPYKRGTPVACAFCRKRKIACGGPQEGDEARRCG